MNINKWLSVGLTCMLFAPAVIADTVTMKVPGVSNGLICGKYPVQIEISSGGYAVVNSDGTVVLHGVPLGAQVRLSTSKTDPPIDQQSGQPSGPADHNPLQGATEWISIKQGAKFEYKCM